MRVAIVGPAFPYKGGGARHTTELAHRLAAAGHDVVIESWRAQYPSFLYPGQQTISEPEGEPFPGTRRRLDWRRPDGWWRTGRALGSCDLVVLVVLSTVQVPSYLGILAGLRGRTPVVALCHNVLPHERKPYDEPLMRRLLRKVDGVLVHTEAQADVARGLTRRPVRVAEMAAHLPAAGAAAPGDGKVRRRLLFFGIVRPYKGLDVLLRALAEGPDDVALTVAGEFWGGLDETRELVRTLDLTSRVELRPGYVPAADVSGLFAAADALVLPYRTATASQNVWMAHEYGLPVIATDVGGFAGQIRDGVDGLVCAPDDVPALAGALRRFYEPGEPERLRSGVRPVDHGPLWAVYIDALTGAVR
ncbi:glycosyltransferase involved in cell wall biosynthesis [Actinomadura coerulea]|uniref:Glycosyltransferase involved in cell wall biosynthesis n=1 Tax=Actinomadura coerulea TaxID=46159 RepID=A0A7X0L0N2_9ACTN|nr:glycosyltransferase family 4 protein [Actinomadura coerulea]MBB6397635.1 glycosyltransferase involved in cell wall biosynthesis [Actinomadura coerulea]GGQ03969.1 glycosyl transferase family 1 [Actinomadura coerulea]